MKLSKKKLEQLKNVSAHHLYKISLMLNLGLSYGTILKILKGEEVNEHSLRLFEFAFFENDRLKKDLLVYHRQRYRLKKEVAFELILEYKKPYELFKKLKGISLGTFYKIINRGLVSKKVALAFAEQLGKDLSIFEQENIWNF